MHGDVLSGSDDTMTDRDTFDIGGSPCKSLEPISNWIAMRQPTKQMGLIIRTMPRYLLCPFRGSPLFILREKLLILPDGTGYSSASLLSVQLSLSCNPMRLSVFGDECVSRFNLTNRNL